jgi:isopenicillin N synthase-like dioxygenase
MAYLYDGCQEMSELQSRAQLACPPIDLSLPETAAAAAIDTTCKDLGFFVVAGHGVSQPVSGETYRQALAFFDLPVAAKTAVARPAAGISRGYNRMADQNHAASFGETGAPDLQESFAIGPSRKGPKPTRALAGFAPEAYAANLIPPQPAGLGAALSAYYAAMERLTERLLALCAVALGAERDFFARRCDQHASILRMVHYPAQTTAPLPGQLRAGAHTDFGTLTILKTDNAPGGLQVRDRDDSWLDVTVPPGSYVINIGDLMRRWSNDRWTSSVHRVVNPPAAAGPQGRRLSMVFFHEPNPDAMVAPMRGDAPPRYPDILAWEHRRTKLAALRGIPTAA